MRSIYNKSIEKSFTYVRGRLKSETITVSSGASQPKGFSIDYKYSNNHMTEAILDNQTTIWRLSDANDFGQPTEVVTGGMTRLYDYDAYGMPMRRRAGRIMDFAYRFDPLTGNLLSRTDNTRLYDPETGRFLSPDPYVQMPDNTQNFNRYSYCMNNPLKYVDKDGKFFFLFLPFAAISNAVYNIFVHGVDFKKYNWKVLRNAYRIDLGMFKGSLMQILGKWTWGISNSFIGNTTAHILNATWQINNVTYMEGMAALSRRIKGKSAFTIGHYSFGPNKYVADWRDHLFVHEYGHYIQSQRMGIVYLPVVGIPSLISASKKDGNHLNRALEPNASALGAKYFDKHYGSGANDYVEGSEDYFDINSFWNGGSPYVNPRTGNYNTKSYRP